VAALFEEDDPGVGDRFVDAPGRERGYVHVVAAIDD